MEQINLGIISPDKDAYSETFIGAHWLYLKGNKKFLFNGYLPLESNDGDLKISFSFFNRAGRKINIFLGQNTLDFHERKLLSYFNHHHLNVILAEYGLTGTAIMNVCKVGQIPLVVHFHGFDAYMTDNVLHNYKIKYQRMFGIAYKIIAVSRHMQDKLIELGCPAEKIVLNPYGPNEIFFKIAPSRNANIFIAVGRFVPKKAPLITIQAFALVLSYKPSVRLYMVGLGEELNKSKKLVSKLGIERSVQFLGMANRDAIAKLFSQSFAFIQHSVTAENGDSEGTPVAILEAMAAGLPVVSTRHAGIPDIVKENQTGFLVDEYDISDMAAKMIYLLENPEIAEQMGEAGRALIKESFTMKKHISKLDTIIETASRYGKK